MLITLHIENVAVIEKAEIEFTPGLNVLTGETGAGKSIVIDSINAVMGARLGREIVRTGCKSAVISAVLTPQAQNEEWLRENDIEPGDELILQRRISEDGKSSCRINGIPVGVGQLRELCEHIFDMHGQNDGAGLLRESSHLDYLDAYAGIAFKRAEYTGFYDAWKTAEREVKRLADEETDKERREDELRGKVLELREANPVEGEEETLTERRAILRNAGKLLSRIDAAYHCMYGDEDTDGALSLVQKAEEELYQAARIANSVEPMAKSARELRYAAAELNDGIEVLRDSLDFSPGELDRIEERLAQLTKLGKKYGSAADMKRLLVEFENELEDVEYLTEKLDKARVEAERKRVKCSSAAAELSAERTKAARLLQDAIVAELRSLSMPGVRFETSITPKEMDATGADEVRFLMSANAGEEPGRISKIASGGELSRIMLAMKTVLSAGEDAQVLVFDEIDTGVSGIAAQRVAEKLAALANRRQVLCVTHLPQIAAMADCQFSIEKQVSGGRTYTAAIRLDDDGRCRELARLTGGDNVTETTLRSADEQLQAAAKYKQELKKHND